MTDAEFNSFQLQVGDVLVNEGQSLELVGRTAVYRGDPAECAFQNSLIRVRAREETDAEFLEYLLRYEYQSGNFARIAARTTSIAHLGVSRLASLRVHVPNLSAQRAIARLLGASSRVIESAERLAELRRVAKRGLMQQLLTGQRRFGEFAQTCWQSVLLGEAFTERIEIGRTDLPLLAITGESGVIHRDDLVRRDSSARDKAKYKRIAPGDIGYNTMRMWQGVSGLSRLEGIVSPAYTVVTPKAEVISPRFAAHLFKFPPVIHRFLRLSQGLVADTLNLKFPVFAKVRVELPSLPEQEAIADVLDAATRELQQLETLLETLGQERLALMHRLFEESDGR